jgi:hypothetical protein
MKNEDKSPEREYEASGLYPEEGKPFRLVALMAGLTGVVVFLAAAAAILNFVLI